MDSTNQFHNWVDRFDLPRTKSLPSKWGENHILKPLAPKLSEPCYLLIAILFGCTMCSLRIIWISRNWWAYWMGLLFSWMVYWSQSKPKILHTPADCLSAERSLLFVKLLNRLIKTFWALETFAVVISGLVKSSSRTSVNSFVWRSHWGSVNPFEEF